MDIDYAIDVEGLQVPAGTTVLSVHIPRYLPLDEEACEKSYAWAKNFFREIFGIKTCVFICGSWLLHPWMQEVLPESSAIIRFQKKFKLYWVEQNVAAAVGWIFPNCKDKDISQYPTDTSLRRAALQRIREGGTIGIARGVRL